jgi:hypothetical protein
MRKNKNQILYTRHFRKLPYETNRIQQYEKSTINIDLA